MSLAAFGVIDAQPEFVYGPTAAYVARSPESIDVVGPYTAPADLLVTEPAFRSRRAAAETDVFAAIYRTDSVEFERPGDWFVLVVTEGSVAPLNCAERISARLNP